MFSCWIQVEFMPRRVYVHQHLTLLTPCLQQIHNSSDLLCAYCAALPSALFVPTSFCVSLCSVRLGSYSIDINKFE